MLDAYESILSCQFTSIANSFGEIMNVGLFCQLLVCAILLAVYMIGLESNSSLSVSFVVSLVGLIYNVILAFIFCFLSEFATHKLSAIGDSFYNFAWYRLPVKQQKMIILPIQRAQNEFRMSGFGVLECSLRVFSKVI